MNSHVVAGHGPFDSVSGADPGGVVALLAEARRGLADVPAAVPAVVPLARCHRAVTAIGTAAWIITEHALPTPARYPRMVEPCEDLAARLGEVIDDVLRVPPRERAGLRVRREDPALHQHGPDLDAAEAALIALTADLHQLARVVAGDEEAPEPVRAAAEATVEVAALVTQQIHEPL
ncbi:hypothetical protein ACWEVD_30045 [Nocardia thailandica]|uniref:hypothetical protein n=1 Tax=Nocardia thailandica TaxID=257275 RepID=UPI0012FAC17B|nr:hypothetical protein [Nocardia thailandica]